MPALPGWFHTYLAMRRAGVCPMTNDEGIPFLAGTFDCAETALMPTDRVHEGPPSLLPLPPLLPSGAPLEAAETSQCASPAEESNTQAAMTPTKEENVVVAIPDGFVEINGPFSPPDIKPLGDQGAGGEVRFPSLPASGKSRRKKARFYREGGWDPGHHGKENWGAGGPMAMPMWVQLPPLWTVPQMQGFNYPPPPGGWYFIPPHH